MKKLLLLIIASFSIAAIAQAQITKGSVLLGINFNTGYNKTSTGPNETRQSNFTFNPSVGFTVKENTIVGFRVSYQHGKTKYNNTILEGETNGYGAGVFARRYAQLGKKVYLFGEGAVDYFYSKSTQQGNNSTFSYKANNATLSFYPGVSYAAGKHFLIEAGLNNLAAISYSNAASTETMGNNTTVHKSSGLQLSTSLSGNTNFSIGFRFLF